MEQILAKESKRLSEVLNYGGSLDIIIDRAATEIEKLKEEKEKLISALGDLSFECFSSCGLPTAPSMTTYNRTFKVLEAARNRD